MGAVETPGSHHRFCAKGFVMSLPRLIFAVTSLMLLASISGCSWVKMMPATWTPQTVEAPLQAG
jgi:hypothetical protein